MRLQLVALLIVAALLGVGVVHAQTPAEIQAQIDEHNAKIKALQEEIAQYEDKVDELGKQKDTLQGAVNSLTLSQKKLAAQLSVTQNKIDSANLELKQLGVEIGDKEVTIAANQEAIAKALREVARTESASLIAQFLIAPSLTDAWQTTEEVLQFNRALSQDINDLKATREALSVNREEVEATKAKLESLRKDLSLEKKSVDISKAAEQKLLADTKNQESSYQKILADKRAEESAFEAALFDLASQLQYALDPSKIPPAGKGVLRWPLDNVYITQQFGKTSSSGRLYASGSHDGIDLRASIGTPVRAAATGTVVEINQGAVPYCQYGKWVLVRHNNGLATLYAHLSDISVAKGEAVVVGEVVGFSGNTGYATGPHLHFGVYYADAVSFKQYTCKSGSPVMIPIAPVNAYLNPLDYL